MGNSFVDFLGQELERKKTNNPAYSMRSLAKHLGIDSGSLSAILNRKIPLTLKRFEKLATHFDLTEDQLREFREEISRVSSSPVAFKILEEDEVVALSKSYYSVILHLFDLTIFENDVDWIANTVGIGREECITALKHLERLKLIRRGEDGGYEKLVDNISLLGGRGANSGLALKELMKDYFSRTYQAIDEVEDERRLHSGTILSIKKSELPDIIEHLRNTRAKILNSQNKTKDKDDIYLLSISMVPMIETCLDKGAVYKD